MNKSLKPIMISIVLAVFGTANAQTAAPVAAPTVAPAAEAHAPAAHAPAAHAPAVQAPVAEAHAPATAPTVVPAEAAEAAPVEAVPAAEVASTAKAEDSISVVLLVPEEPKKKKRKGSGSRKGDLTLVDVPANFEIQARKVMPVDSDGWGEDNLDTWWGRANLMVSTESDNFVGKIHLRMYPGQFYGDEVLVRKVKRKNGEIVRENGKIAYDSISEHRDIIQLYEAWAWHRGDYVNVKIGRWDNTTRFGSKTFGGYIDAKKNYDKEGNYKDNRKAGFMSTYDPENALQFGLNNFSENVSLDIALITSDPNLNKGDLRIYFSFKELAGLENMNIGIGYRANIFDEIYSKYGDVTHTIDFAFRTPIIKEGIGLLKSLSFFAEAAMIGLDDAAGELDVVNGKPIWRADKGSSSGNTDFAFPILGGFDIELERGLDKIVIEAEWDSDRNREVQGSIYVQKKLNDRFTLNMGVQSENNTKDFSFAGRLQGKIN